jgi:hypothetical protein
MVCPVLACVDDGSNFALPQRESETERESENYLLFV